MKILFFNFSVPYVLSENDEFEGGIAVEWLNWITAFRELGHDVALLTWKGAGKIIKKKINFELIESYDPKKGIPKLRMGYIQIPSIIRDIRAYNPDVIIQGGANLHCVLMGICSKITSKKFIHRIASDADVDNRTNEFISGIELWLYKRTRGLIDTFSVQNDYQYDVLMKEFPQKKIFKVYNIFKGDIHLQPKKKSDRNYVAWVGHFRRVKNLPTLRDICAKLKDINFKIAGIAYDDIDGESKKAIVDLKKMNNVEFVGYIANNQIQEFLSKSVCLLNTSILEGFSNTFIEAWSVGTPVITTLRVNPDNLINKYHLGKVADTDDELIKMIESVYNLQHEEYNQLSTNCFEYLKQNHTSRYLANQFINEIS